jgi:exosortase A
MNAAIRTWGGQILMLLLVWGALFVLLEPAGSSMRAIWDRSETYAHGYAILPIVLWLVWRKRSEVAATPLSPDAWALLPAFGLGFVWLAGRVVGAQVVEHFALVGLMIVSVWALFGRALVWVLFFPLFFLLLMVPAGDSLIEPLIHFTADFTVATVRLTGIPVLQEGTFIELPTGEWSVVEACSGIRYFLSSIVLGWLFAYLTYRTWWKRVAFGVAAIVVPVIANGFRATLIVLIGHFSGMTLAVGVDHLIYGWVWFGIVILSMFWIGNFWREDVEEDQVAPVGAFKSATRTAWLTAVAMVALVAIFPIYEHQISSSPATASPLARWTPPASWQIADAELSAWRPRWQGMDDQRVLTLERDGKSVMLFLAWYGSQRQGSELISSRNVLVPEKDPVWRNLLESGTRIKLNAATLPVRQATLYSPATGQRLLVWYWRRIDGESDTNIYRGKLRLAGSKLAGRGDAGSGVIIAAPYEENTREAELILQAFVTENSASLNRVLDAEAGLP